MFRDLVDIFKRWPLIGLLCAQITIILLIHFLRAEPAPKDFFSKRAEYLGRVEEPALAADGMTRVRVKLLARIAPLTTILSDTISLTIDEDCPFEEGAQIRFKAKLSAPRAFKNPGVSDFRAQLLRDGIIGKAFSEKCSDVTADKISSASGFAGLRNRITKMLTQSDLKHGGFLTETLIGISATPKADRDALRRAGLSHLLAISGMNFTVMSAIIYGLISLITNFFPKIYLYFPRQKIAAFGTLIFLIFYVPTVTNEPSVWRSAFLIAFLSLALVSSRQAVWPHALALSLFVILLIKPSDLFSTSLHLSYAGVLALCLIWSYGQKILESKSWWFKLPRVLRYFLVLLGSTFIVQITLMPLQMHLFGTLTPAGLWQNLWAVPYFDFVLAPLSLAGWIFIALHLPFTDLILKIWDHSAGLFLKILTALSTTAPNPWNVMAPHESHIIIFYLGFFLILIWPKYRKKIAAIWLSLLTLSLMITSYNLFWRNDLRITMIDVGQGDSTLIRTRDETWLIDTGGHRYLDIGELVLKPFFRHEWLGHINTLVITHGDRDHFGGAESLIGSVPIDKILINDQIPRDQSYADLLQKARDASIPIEIAKADQKFHLDQNTAIKVLSPTPELDLSDNDNDHSVVLRLTHNNTSFLFTGDISKAAERKIVARYGSELRSEALKIAHHGSRGSSGPSFLMSVKPMLALIGVGEHSQFGHPHPEVLSALKALGTTVFRTDQDGAIRITAQNGHFQTTSWTGQNPLFSFDSQVKTEGNE